MHHTLALPTSTHFTHSTSNTDEFNENEFDEKLAIILLLGSGPEPLQLKHRLLINSRYKSLSYEKDQGFISDDVSHEDDDQSIGILTGVPVSKIVARQIIKKYNVLRVFVLEPRNKRTTNFVLMNTYLRIFVSKNIPVVRPHTKDPIEDFASVIFSLDGVRERYGYLELKGGANETEKLNGDYDIVGIYDRRPVFCLNGTSYIYYWGENKTWWIGPDVGSNTAFCASDDIEGPWVVYGDDTVTISTKKVLVEGASRTVGSIIADDLACPRPSVVPFEKLESGETLFSRKMLSSRTICATSESDTGVSDSDPSKQNSRRNTDGTVSQQRLSHDIQKPTKSEPQDSQNKVSPPTPSQHKPPSSDPSPPSQNIKSPQPHDKRRNRRSEKKNRASNNSKKREKKNAPEVFNLSPDHKTTLPDSKFHTSITHLIHNSTTTIEHPHSRKSEPQQFLLSDGSYGQSDRQSYVDDFYKTEIQGTTLKVDVENDIGSFRESRRSRRQQRQLRQFVVPTMSKKL